MSDDQYRFLSLLKQPPVRLTVEQVACLLNCHPSNIPYLVAKGHLHPLGSPPENGVKFFALAEVIECTRSPNWLAKITNAVHKQWEGKNRDRRQGGSDDSEAMAS